MLSLSKKVPNKGASSRTPRFISLHSSGQGHTMDLNMKRGKLLCSLDGGVFIFPPHFYFSGASIFALVTSQDPSPL